MCTLLFVYFFVGSGVGRFIVYLVICILGLCTQKYLLELIKQHAGKMYQIGKNACRPLTPAVRREWVLEPYEMEEAE